MDWVSDWGATRRRFQAFWRQEVADRCMIAVTAPAEGAPPRATGDRAAVALERRWTDGEYILKQNLRRFEETYFAGDAFPQIWLNLGASGHAAYFAGARYGFDTSTIWFEPSLCDGPAADNDPPAIEFDLQAPLYRTTLELARYLSDEARGRFFVSMPDTSGNLDALAHLRGSEGLLIDMLSRPDWVHRELVRVQDAWRQTVESVFQITHTNNDGGSTIGWLNTWAPGRHAQMQCDLSVMISPESFVEFAVPELQSQIEWMDHSLYHFDGVDQARHLDALLDLDGLHAIQFTCVAGQASPVHYLPLLKRIQDAGKSLLIPLYEGAEQEEIVTLLEELSSKGLMLIARADSAEEADEIVSLAGRYTHE